MPLANASTCNLQYVLCPEVVCFEQVERLVQRTANSHVNTSSSHLILAVNSTVIISNINTSTTNTHAPPCFITSNINTSNTITHAPPCVFRAANINRRLIPSASP
jgi:hypothetical protein